MGRDHWPHFIDEDIEDKIDPGSPTNNQIIELNLNPGLWFHYIVFAIHKGNAWEAYKLLLVPFKLKTLHCTDGLVSVNFQLSPISRYLIP